MRPIHSPVFLLPVLLCLTVGQITAQDIAGSVRKARVDLAVPDNPAYNIIGGTSSEIMRPGSLREVSVLLGNMLSSNPVIPEATAFEVSPMLLASNPTLEEYSAARCLYNTRLSFATTSGENGARQLSFGIRIALIDETDLRTNSDLIKAYRDIADEMNAMQAECLAAHPDWMQLEDHEREKRIEQCVTEKVGIKLDPIIRHAREQLKAESWNNAIMEIGAAGATRSNDSLVANLMSSAYSFWATWAQPVFGAHGQLLIGLRGASVRGADNTFGEDEAAAALRCYVGSNDFKGFLEFDFLARSGMTPVSTGALGIELNLYNGIWIDGSAGLEKAGSDATRITGGFNLRLATPEVKL